jgi:hypothetical protein
LKASLSLKTAFKYMPARERVDQDAYKKAPAPFFDKIKANLKQKKHNA